MASAPFIGYEFIACFVFLDRWGGIWEADRSYTFTAKTDVQTNVRLLKKFDYWYYGNSGIDKRMPWISDEKLTTSSSTNRRWVWLGTITGENNKID